MSLTLISAERKFFKYYNLNTYSNFWTHFISNKPKPN